MEIAVQEQNLAAIRQRLTQGDTPQDHNHLGIPVLYDALRTNNRDILEAFQSARADWNTPYNHQGYTPLVYASLYCEQGTIEWLLEHGQSIRQKTARGISVLHVAAQRGDLAIARFLHHHGADPFAATEHNEVPLLVSLKAKRGLSVFKMLLACYEQQHQSIGPLVMTCLTHILEKQQPEAIETVHALLPFIESIPTEQQIRAHMLTPGNYSSFLLRSIENTLESRLSAAIFALLRSEQLIRNSTPATPYSNTKRWQDNGGL